MLKSSKRTAQREAQSADPSKDNCTMDLSRFDGNRDPVPAPTGGTQLIAGISNNCKNVDLGAAEWADARGVSDSSIFLRALILTLDPGPPLFPPSSEAVHARQEHQGYFECLPSHQPSFKEDLPVFGPDR